MQRQETIPVDITPHFSSVLEQLDAIKPFARFCSPGHVNDLDMMQVGNGLSLEEEKTHFAMWCMLSTPLMIGCDLTKIPEETLEILKNTELIAVNQDPLCRQAVVIKEYRSENGELLGEIWGKDLISPDSGEKAVAFLNRSGEAVKMEIGLEEAGVQGADIQIRDLCRHEDCESTDVLQAVVPAHGAVVFRVRGEHSAPVRDLNQDLKYGTEAFRKITLEEAYEMAGRGGVLVDTRTAEGFEKWHLDGAVNVPYAEIYLNAQSYLPDRDQAVIVYCSTGKRSSMAKLRLDFLGYGNVYFLGGVSR